ncbi:MAG TPA: nuclear transport factor 2 family protein [Flavobacterium sp.]|jgi:hypothetical protein
MLNPHEQLIEEFYAGFAIHDAETMLSCYHEDIVFSDPVFGTLHGQDVADMWRMLIERSKGHLEVEFSNIKADNKTGSARWIATYNFSRTNRKVVNSVESRFVFQDDLIIRHSDSFNVHNWSKQALGLSGLLFGWTPFLQKKIQKQSIALLRKYQSIQS